MKSIDKKVVLSQIITTSLGCVLAVILGIVLIGNKKPKQAIIHPITSETIVTQQADVTDTDDSMNALLLGTLYGDYETKDGKEFHFEEDGSFWGYMNPSYPDVSDAVFFLRFEGADAMLVIQTKDGTEQTYTMGFAEESFHTLLSDGTSEYELIMQ